MAEILVGTASWTDKTLIESGRFYPRSATSAEERLRYYATQFPLVEVDSTYYALPAERTAELWAERTPPRFVFNVKAFRLFSGHAAQRTAVPADLRRKKGLASAAERFDYLYSAAELEALSDPVKNLAARARRVHVLFNNCHGDKAQRNAAQFRELLATQARAAHARSS